MHILLLTQYFSTVAGGGEYLYNIMAQKLAEENHKIWIISTKIKDEKYDLHKNINLIQISPELEKKGGLQPSFFANLLYSFNAIKTGLKIIRNEKIDLIHSNNFAPSLSGSILSFFTSTKHIITIHDIVTLCSSDYWKKWKQQRGVSKINTFLGPIFEKLILQLKHNAIHTVSESTRDDLIKFKAKKPIFVIDNFLHSENIVQKNNPEIDIHQFIYIGRMVFYKNLEVVLKAIKLAKTQFPKINLKIIGDGPQKESLQNLASKLGIEENVEFMGYVSDTEKQNLIARSNALVFPSFCEGFGLVILEAFSHKKPVLVSDIRPMSDIVSNNESGFVIGKDDHTSWSEHLCELIKNPEHSHKMGIIGNELLKSRYSDQKFYEKLMEMYQQVVKST